MADPERDPHPARVASLAHADLVTLDRVVCCDPDYGSMLRVAAEHAAHLLAFTYPRPRLITRAVVAAANGMCRLMGRAFRAYVHPPEAMTAVLEHAGFRPRWLGGTWVWAVALFERAG
jgi:magnesium-protoporphyrin O-methyltransferase